MTNRSNPDARAEAAWRLQVVVGDAAPPGLPKRATLAGSLRPPSRAKPAPIATESDDRSQLGGPLDHETLAGDSRQAESPSTKAQRPSAMQTESSEPADATEGDSPGGVVKRLGAGLIQLGRAHAGVLGVVVVVALVFTGSRLMAAQGHEVAGDPMTPSMSVAAASPSAPSPAPPSPAVIWVHVMGAVVNPGLVSLPAGARVADAIVAAGGLAPDADPAELNLAQPVPDGAQLVIGTSAEPRGELRAAGTPGSGGAEASSPGGGAANAPTLNLNTATAAQLETLPGIGPATAAKIIAWRDAHGSFTRVEELQEVDGIGPKTYAQLEPLVHV